jgi:hypothetical protein
MGGTSRVVLDMKSPDVGCCDEPWYEFGQADEIFPSLTALSEQTDTSSELEWLATRDDFILDLGFPELDCRDGARDDFGRSLSLTALFETDTSSTLE